MTEKAKNELRWKILELLDVFDDDCNVDKSNHIMKLLDDEGII